MKAPKHYWATLTIKCWDSGGLNSKGEFYMAHPTACNFIKSHLTYLLPSTSGCVVNQRFSLSALPPIPYTACPLFSWVVKLGLQIFLFLEKQKPWSYQDIPSSDDSLLAIYFYFHSALEALTPTPTLSKWLLWVFFRTIYSTFPESSSGKWNFFIWLY